MVTVLYPYPVPENKTGAQTIDTLTKRLIALGAVQKGNFLVDCETYTSVPELGSRTVHILHNSEHPASVFSIIDGSKQIALVADGLFDLVMLKMTPFYSSKKQTKLESKGPRFELGDFLIKLGSVTMSQNFKGILVEIEYRPCSIPINCWELIREFLQGFLNMAIPKVMPNYFQSPSATQRVNDVYQVIDTIQQYLENFTNYRKQTMPI